MGLTSGDEVSCPLLRPGPAIRKTVAAAKTKEARSAKLLFISDHHQPSYLKSLLLYHAGVF
jgi:hypothetical protein